MTCRPSLLGRMIGAAFRLSVLAALAVVIWWALLAGGQGQPDRWSIFAPLDVSAPPNLLTGFKLRRASRDPVLCQAALTPAATFTPLPAFDGDGGCGIDPRLRLTRIGQSEIAAVETTCATALRLAMWERHVLQPAAQSQFGQGVARVRHQGSYNCRAVRGGGRLSSHATAMAIDVNGVVLADGAALPLEPSWTASGSAAAFWRAARDGGCRWFETVLGPDYDAAHADHLHLQASGRGLCR